MNDREVLEALYATVENRRDNPKEGSYTCYLLDKGIDKILKKVGEECSETIIAAKNDDNSETVYEIADLIYHLTVMMVKLGIPLEDVLAELDKCKQKGPMTLVIGLNSMYILFLCINKSKFRNRLFEIIIRF